MQKTPSQRVNAFSSVGVDIGKDVFHVVAFDLEGKVALQLWLFKSNVKPAVRRIVGWRQKGEVVGDSV